MGVMPPGLGAVRAERAPAGCDIARNADGGRLMAKYSTLDALATGEGVAMLGSVARLPKATASVYCGANGLERGRGRGALSPGADSARCRCAEAQMGSGAGGCFCLIVSGRKADSAAVALRRNMISSTEEAASCGGGIQNGLYGASEPLPVKSKSYQLDSCSAYLFRRQPRLLFGTVKLS